ncbi:MAG TPA: thiolase family protein [Myxococcota bacterium]|nr:thiolase family protein [Myxococcota bacterium]
MARNPLHDVAIVGAYHTRQARVLEGVREIDLILDAARGALAAAGLGWDQVDGLNLRGTRSRLHSREAAHLFGGRPRWTGLGLGIEGVLEAAGAIATGQCHTVLLADAQAGEYVDRAATSPWTRPSSEFVECFGLYTAAEFALCAKRHMHLYGTRPESLAHVAATIRNHGAQHPEAVHYGRRVTPEDVLASRLVAEPFHLLDCAMNSEGGAGLVLTHASRVRDLDVTPVYLLGGALERLGMAYVAAPVWDHCGHVGRWAAEQAFAACGLSPADVDVCEFYDPFSFELIRQFEAYGFCGDGEGGDFVQGDRIEIGGEFPLVTCGGLMSFSHAGTAQLLQKVIHSVHQLQGRVPDALKVPGASVAMTSNGGSGALFTDVLLLGLDRA